MKSKEKVLGILEECLDNLEELIYNADNEEERKALELIALSQYRTYWLAKKIRIYDNTLSNEYERKILSKKYL